MKYLILTLALLTTSVNAMSYFQGTEVPANVTHYTAEIPFLRESGATMTVDEYAQLNVYINGELYPYAHPVVTDAHLHTLLEFQVVTYIEVFDVQLTLTDSAGRESTKTEPIHWDFSAPSAPISTCK